MKANKIDPISVAGRNLDDARRIWEPVLGNTAPDDAYVDEAERTRVARYWVGEVGFELMESLFPDGEVARFTERRGEGVMLVSLNVDRTRSAARELEAGGYPLVGGIRSFRDCEIRIRSRAGAEPRAARNHRLAMARAANEFAGLNAIRAAWLRRRSSRP